jgi:hypothetical protein
MSPAASGKERARVNAWRLDTETSRPLSARTRFFIGRSPVAMTGLLLPPRPEDMPRRSDQLDGEDGMS